MAPRRRLGAIAFGLLSLAEAVRKPFVAPMQGRFADRRIWRCLGNTRATMSPGLRYTGLPGFVDSRLPVQNGFQCMGECRIVA